MQTRYRLRLRHYLRRAVSTLATVALSVAVTILVMRAVSPQQAHAQQGQAGDVRATSFTLVGQDGTVLARLQTGGQGNGELRLYDATGNLRAELAGAGFLIIRDPDGLTPRFRAGFTTTTSRDLGLPPFNGVQLDPNGTIGVLTVSP